MIDQQRLKEKTKELNRGKYLKWSAWIAVVAALALTFGLIYDLSFLIISFFILIFVDIILVFYGLVYFVKRQFLLRQVVVEFYWIPYLNQLAFEDGINYRYVDPFFENDTFESHLNLHRQNQTIHFTITTDAVSMSLLTYSRYTGNQQTVTDFAGLVLDSRKDVMVSPLTAFLTDMGVRHQIIKTQDDHTLVALDDIEFMKVRTKLNDENLEKMHQKLHKIHHIVRYLTDNE